MYKSIKENVVTTLMINKSEFISHLYKCSSVDEANEILSDIRSKYNDANHNCYAYVIGKSRNIKKCSDDGEPSQTAGMPILNVLEHNNLTDVICVVTRYFGGIKLGAGGLVRAYSKSCSSALDIATITEKVPATIIEIVLDYKLAPKLEHYLNDNNYKLEEKKYFDKVSLFVCVSDERLVALKEYVVNLTSDSAIIEEISKTYIEV